MSNDKYVRGSAADKKSTEWAILENKEMVSGIPGVLLKSLPQRIIVVLLSL